MPVDVLNGDGGLSLFDLFLKADIVVKLVMLGLILVSLWCWAIIFEKSLRISTLKRKADNFEDAFWSGSSLDELYDRIDNRPTDPMQTIFVSAMREWRRGSSSTRSLENSNDLKVSMKQRIDRSMDLAIMREMSSMEKGLNFLATASSAAPFVGLFGTVWGIMNAFTAIANEGNTNLTVVAPGIAEALFATALGLVAAIPATIAYNKFSSQLSAYAGRLESFAGEYSTILSRQLDSGN
jgi:biopolymer transport protein TolQ